MAIDKVQETADKLSIDINNGDLKALAEIKEKWKFKDKESALRFALAVLTLSGNGNLSIRKADGTSKLLQPGDELLEK